MGKCSVMLVSLKRAAFVTQLRISPTPVIQSSVLTVKKPATWLVIAPLLLLVIFARLQIIWLANVLLLGPPSLKFFLKMNQTTRRLFVRLTRLWTTMTNLRQFLGSRLAQRLLTSSTKWKAMLLLLLKNSLPPLKMMMIITRSPSTENISPTSTPNPPLPNGWKTAKHIDSSAPTRITRQPTLITGKGRELSDESDENTPLAKRNHSGTRTNKHKKHRP